MYVYAKGNCSDIVDEIESRIRIQKGLRHFVFSDRKASLGMARAFLNKCDGERDVAFEVINAFFDPKVRMSLGIRYQVNHIGTMMAKGSKFDTALAYARDKAKCEHAEPIVQRTMFNMEPAYVGAD